MSHPLNLDVASRLDEAAALLAGQRANPYRVRAWRRAADSVRALEEPVSELFRREGLAGLEALPGVGEQMAQHIRDLVERGALPMLDRLRHGADPTAVLTSVPGIGPVLAHELIARGIGNLEELETAATDGRLAQVPGVGAKRLAGIRDTIAHRLERVRRPRAATAARAAPPVAELLDVDREYREKAAAGALRRIAPRRLNPTGEAWLPVLRTTRGARRYTALFSNTAHAHEAGRTRDWVVLYFDDGGGEQQSTVVTAERGPLAGRRIVRGREAECAALARPARTSRGR